MTIRKLGLAAGLALVLVMSTMTALMTTSGDFLLHNIPGSAKQAYAWGGACGNPSDNPGTIYTGRDYLAKDWPLLVGGTIHTDIQTLDYTGSDGHCYIGYRASAWGTGGSDYYVNLRVWVCGHQESDQHIGTSHNAGGQQVTSQQFDGYSAGNGAKYMWVGQFNDTIMFIDSSGCGPQADQIWTYAYNSFWSAQPTSSYCGAWYASIPPPIYC